MINTLDHYICDSLPWEGCFETKSNLRDKVSGEGKLLPFYGNTTVFLLDNAAKAMLQGIQKELYDAAGWMLAERLQPETFHMTLHDLANGPALDEALEARVEKTAFKAQEILKLFQDQLPLRMEATWLFNMVNTSIVLGLKPRDEDSWQRLDWMYTQLEQVVPLGYGLTPHITMAYFRPGIYRQEELAQLRQALRPVRLRMELKMENLVHQYFVDMNSYSLEKW